MTRLRFGVEIETQGLERARLAEILRAVFGTSPTYDPTSARDAAGRLWRVVRDGSLGMAAAGEIVTPILGYEDLPLLHNVVAAVQAAGASADARAGIHVHVGAEALDAPALCRLVMLAHKQERLMEHVLGIHDRRLQQYCRSIAPELVAQIKKRRPRTSEALRELWYASHGAAAPLRSLAYTQDRYHESRYRGLNLHSYFYRQTIEFRYFNGSVDPHTVVAYAHLALSLVAKAHHARTASSERRSWTPETAKYDWRVFLLGLGLIGDEFKATRRVLTAHLAGSAAWKGQRRDRARGERARVETVPAVPRNEMPVVATAAGPAYVGPAPEEGPHPPMPSVDVAASEPPFPEAPDAPIALVAHADVRQAGDSATPAVAAAYRWLNPSRF